MKRSFVAVLPAVAATLVAHESSANPPPPKVLPDPPVTAPVREEAPNVVRKHDGLCFAFYPAGGTLPVECPAELVTEPIGEALLKAADGRCQFLPFQSGAPGRTGFTDKCPAMFAQVAKAGVIPDESIRIVQQAAAAREKDVVPTMDPPIPARLETTPPQQVGCGVGHTSDPSRHATTVMVVAALAALTRRRR